MRRGRAGRRWRWLAGALLLALAAALGANLVTRQRQLGAETRQARIDVRLRAALIDSELARFRLMPLALADDRDVLAAVAGVAAARRGLDLKLERLARETGASVIYVIARSGLTLAASNWRRPESFVGSDYRFRPYFREARARGVGSQFALGTVSRLPGLYLAHRTANGGVVVVKLDFAPVERAWRQAGGITFVRGGDGIVLVTSRPDLRFATTRPLTAMQAARFRLRTSLGAGGLAPLPALLSARRSGGPPAGAYATAELPVDQPGWRLTLLRPAAPALAQTRAIVTALAFVLVMGLAVSWRLWRQRVRLARRRKLALERAVGKATAALRREMAERAAGEARAAELRDALRQANRLAALGQITAGVAHETAQPVTAIRTYAQTSVALLEQGAHALVRDNLAAIARLADRVGRITVELRGFARRQTGPLRPVALAEVMAGARLILKEQLRAVTLTVAPLPPALHVVGGRVRLEQVLVILIQNALEAVADRTDGRIAIDWSDGEGDHVMLTVTDNGPGIDPAVAARLFTPFVTSRPAGLGLGLVIARDIMEELGGWLRNRPVPAGACFELAARRA